MSQQGIEVSDAGGSRSKRLLSCQSSEVMRQKWEKISRNRSCAQFFGDRRSLLLANFEHLQRYNTAERYQGLARTRVPAPVEHRAHLGKLRGSRELCTPSKSRLPARFRRYPLDHYSSPVEALASMANRDPQEYFPPRFFSLDGINQIGQIGSSRCTGEIPAGRGGIVEESQRKAV
jgi:hypothetical protein